MSETITMGLNEDRLLEMLRNSFTSPCFRVMCAVIIRSRYGKPVTGTAAQPSIGET